MRCKTCDYRLWGAKGRQCPECGTPFLPSQFEFIPNSVRFCCPHCGQDYYGTGPRGHLVPPEFNCAQCGRHVHMDEMVLFPTQGLEEEQTQVEQMPWFERDRVRFLRRWLRTIYMGMFSPSHLMELTPSGSSVGQAWLFAALTAGLASCAGMLPVLIFPMLMIGSRGLGVLALGGFALPLMVQFLWPSILIALWGAVAHAVLAITGQCKSGAGRTYQAVCYSAAPNIIVAVPCLGINLFPVAWIWWSISAILMIRQGQRVGAARATIAVMSLPAILAAGTTCLIIFVAIPGIRSAMQASTTAAQQANLALVTNVLSSYARQHGGRPPGHACELIATAGTPASAFMHNDQQALPKVPVAGTDLQQFSTSPPSSQLALAQAAAGALPAKVVAHRLGDFVFTYHGINFNKADRGLWIVVLAPEGPQVPQPRQVHIALADGTTTQVRDSRFAQALVNQNALRAAQGLPPLPDPRKVTHSQPAAAP